MADISAPPAGEKIALEDGRTNSTWWRFFQRVGEVANQAARQLASTNETITDIGNTRAAKSDQPEAVSGALQIADNGDYSFFWPYANSEVSATLTKCATGTATATFKKDGVAFPGTANSVSTSEQSQAHTPVVTLSQGDMITVTISGSASCEGLSFMLSGTRDLI